MTHGARGAGLCVFVLALLGDHPQEALVVNFRDDMVSNMVVMFLRMLTSCEIQRRSDFFGAFLAGMYDDPAAASVDTFCGRFVEPMGEESDNIHIVAISDALRVPLRVVYLDRSGADNGQASEVDVTTHDFVPEGMPPDSAPRVHLLYRPGHYDVLYPMGSAASMLQSQTAQQQQMQQGQQQQQTQ